MTKLTESPLELRLSQMTDDERARLKKRLRVQGDASRPLKQTGITPRTDQNAPAPLSFAQELMWLLHQMAPNLSTYHVPRAFRVTGSLDLEALQQAVRHVMSRHEVLRTIYGTVDGNPAQIVTNQGPLTLHVENASGMSAADREQRMNSFLLEHSREPIDLERNIPLRVSVLRLGVDDFLVVIVTHHIASDGASKGIFYRELEACYRAALEGRAPDLPPLPVQMADYAVWQRSADAAGYFDKELAFWQSKLSGAPELLDLPTDRPRPAFQSFQGGRHYEDFDAASYRRLKALAKAEHSTPFTVMLAVFQTLLHRYTRQTDLVIGTPVAGRNHDEVQELIGCFANVLVLRTEMSGDPTFRELLRRSRAVLLESLAHQSAPFEKLVVDLARKRYGSHTPLFQVLFALGNNAAESLDFPGATTTFIKADRGIAKFDLSLGLTESPDGLTGMFEYSLDLFEAETIHRMAEHFRILMQAVAENPDLRISELPLLSARERQQVLFDWNQSASAKSPPLLLHESFECRVRETPDALAVLSAGSRLTYGELNSRANALAQEILQRNLPRESPVALYAPRSLEYAVGLMGILKAGAAVLPLDQAYPPDRLAFMLQDSGAKLLLSTSEPVSWELGQEVTILRLDATQAIPETRPRPQHQPEPDAIAFILYTSGSTGKPRGVLLTHRGLANETEWASSYFGITREDRVLQFASLSFDMAIEEMFCAWNRGAAVVFRDDRRSLTGPDFLEWLDQEQVSVMDVPTAYWHEFVRETANRRHVMPKGLRLVVVGGEQAQPAIHAQWMKIGGKSIRWVNTYGPTETSIVATAFEYHASAPRDEMLRPPPIGKAIHNYKTYVLDDRQQPVPIGVTGELYIGGPGVAQGYLAQPELTAQRFVPDPFDGSHRGRMYRTGDLACWSRDGNLEFLGRCDHQIKIRGFRVEPAEIESVLGQFPAVCESLVIARPDPADSTSKRLVAYVVMSAGAVQDIAELRTFLASRLPQYLIPTHLIFLNALPLNANGKVDRSKLPEPDWSAVALSEEFTPPRTDAERIIAGIWCDELHRQQIGIHDDFFELGGESLLGARMLLRVGELFGRQIPLSALFQHPTIAQLAVVAQKSRVASIEPVIHEIRPGTQGPPLFVAHTFLGEWVYYQPLFDRLSAHQPIYVFEPPTENGRRREFTTLEDAASAYADKLCEFYPQGPFCLAGYCFGGKLAYEVARQLLLRGREIAYLGIIDTGFSPHKLKLKPDPLREVMGFLTNLPLWVRHDLLNPQVESLGHRVHRFMKRFLRKAKARLFENGQSAKPIVFEDIINLKLVSPKILDFAVSALKSVREYQPRPLPVRVTLYRAQVRPLFRTGREDLGWKQLALDGVDIQTIPGHHSSILKAPAITFLADQMQAALDQISRACSGR